MAIRSAAAGTSTTLGFTNQRDGDFSNTLDAELVLLCHLQIRHGERHAGSSTYRISVLGACLA